MPPKLGELLKLVKGHPQVDVALVVLYHVGQSSQPATSGDIKTAIKSAHYKGVEKANWSDVIARLVSDGLVHDTGNKRGAATLWEVTDSGSAKAKQLLGIVEPASTMQPEVASLMAIARGIADDDVRDYLLEGINCLGVDALRASIVFIWAGALRTIQQHLVNKFKLVDINKKLQTYQPKNKDINTMDDWQYIKDEHTLLAARDLGVYSKTEETMLGHHLGLRNQCGHPSTYKPTPTKTRAFMEEVIDLVFKRLS